MVKAKIAYWPYTYIGIKVSDIFNAMLGPLTITNCAIASCRVTFKG